MSIFTPNLFSKPCIENMIALALKHAKFNTSSKTYSAYRLTLERFQSFCISENLELRSITRSDIHNFVSSRKNTVNPRTSKPYSFFWLNIEIAILIKSFGLAVEKKLIGLNPASRFKKFKAVSEREPIEQKDIKTFLKTIRTSTKNINYYYAILIALNSGMRKSEICYLKWEQINFSTMQIKLVNKINEEIQYAYFNNVTMKVLNKLKEINPPGNNTKLETFRNKA